MDTTNVCQLFKTTKGGVKLNVNGFTYEKNKKVESKFYWVCELRKETNCIARAITLCLENTENHTIVKAENNHNHDPDANRVNVANLTNNLKSVAAKDVSQKPCQIIQNALAKYGDQPLQMPSTSAMKQVIYREKKKHKEVFHEPTDIYFTINHDKLKLNDENIIMNDVLFKENKRIIIYSSRKMMDFLCRSTLWILDGTFKIVPSQFQQLYAIHGNVMSNRKTTVPLLFALCTNKDKNTYNKLFEFIIEYSNDNNILLNVQNCVMDFELAAIQCCRQHFDGIKLNGCHFHLAQIIYRQIQTNGLTVMYGKNIRFALEMKSLLALSFLSPSEIPEYFKEWVETILPESVPVATWFDVNYISGGDNKPPRFHPSFWSIIDIHNAGLPRTQNFAEAWHNRINTLMGKSHPGFYFFSTEIMKESHKVMLEIESILNGEPEKKKRKKTLNRTLKINEILTKKGEYTKEEFLRALASNLYLH